MTATFRDARGARTAIRAGWLADRGAAANTVLLVRPNGYVAFRGEPPDPAALEAYLGELFTTAR